MFILSFVIHDPFRTWIARACLSHGNSASLPFPDEWTLSKKANEEIAYRAISASDRKDVLPRLFVCDGWSPGINAARAANPIDSLSVG